MGRGSAILRVEYSTVQYNAVYSTVQWRQRSRDVYQLVGDKAYVRRAPSTVYVFGLVLS